MTDKSPNSLTAMGIGVADLARSVDFYTRVLGLQQVMPLSLPDMDEVILGFPGHPAAVVLMHWTDGSERNYTGNPAKLVFTVDDAAAIIESIRAEGLAVTREAAAVPELGGMIIAFATDPDGYVIELMQALAAGCRPFRLRR